MSEVHLRQNDTLPPLEFTLKDRDGAYPYSTADTLRFVMKSSAGTVIVDQTSTGPLLEPVNSTAGTGRYNWSSSDTGTPGDYLGEIELHPLAGGVLSFPNTGHIEILITPELST